MTTESSIDITKILVAGEWIETETTLEVSSPYDSRVVGVTCLGSEADLARAANAAEVAFGELKAWPAHKRAALLTSIADGINGRSEELAATISGEAGKPIKEARGEVTRAENTFRIAAEEAKRMGGEVLPLDVAPGADGRFGLLRRFPVGPVLGISPFNFPLNLVAHKIAPALAVGCPILLKPASATPLSALLLGEIVVEVGQAAGLPVGTLSVIPADGPVAGTLLDNPAIKKLTFTGSPEIGWMLKARAGTRKVTLELGGNAGVIVMDDANVEHAAQRCITGAFANAGQVCISVQRIYVHSSVFDKFKDSFIAKAQSLVKGDPREVTTELGPMIDPGAIEKTIGWIDTAVKDGATLLTGGTREGNILAPTVLTRTTPDMSVCSDELFAPVVVLEPFDDFDAVLEAVNSGPFGLQAGLFTTNMNSILKAYETLEVGGVIAGDIPTFRTDNMPYGGVKSSGYGREGVKYAMEEMCETRLLVLQKP
ncbi:MAG: aldehyde dehydrogenase family protein [Proteobacteria bacterium]|nr:aldehyde dehydrogenase family protein [Pseudomonadota bacterium]